MNAPRLNTKHLIKLFNLGLHLNNEQNIIFSHQNNYTRAVTTDLSNKAAIISNPIWMTQQYIHFLQVFRRLLENEENLMVINTDPVYSGYLEFFEGSGITYHEVWPPGTLSNPQAKNGLPNEEITLVVLISASLEDRKVILSEIKSRDLPVINLTPYAVEKPLFSATALPNRNFLHFYLQLIKYLVHTHKKKNWSLLSSSVLSGNPVNQLDEQDDDSLHQIQDLFSKLKKQRVQNTKVFLKSKFRK